MFGAKIDITAWIPEKAMRVGMDPDEAVAHLPGGSGPCYRDHMNETSRDAPDALARRVLALFQHRPFAWITDVDGTLSPIAQRPEDAVVPAELRSLLHRLKPHVDHLIVASGRAPAHALAMVEIVEATYIGNHGLSLLRNGEERTLPEAAPYVARVAEVAGQIERAVVLEGMIIENKGPVLALHYRQSPDPEAARAALMEAAHRFGSPQALELHEGRRVVELRPPLPQNKGTAIRAFVLEHAVRGALYLGDDVTDIDAFRALRALREEGVAVTAGIAVAEREVDPRVLSEADERVKGVAGVERLLRAVVTALEATAR